MILSLLMGCDCLLMKWLNLDSLIFLSFWLYQAKPIIEAEMEAKSKPMPAGFSNNLISIPIVRNNNFKWLKYSSHNDELERGKGARLIHAVVHGG